ncbi:hypothetical protein MSAN_01052900 [Mycena sanguinolenta]|uniref:F-box domain-containing protein n=1 Tax=Mycena sanguinolenta TaxID=230812 RepID=A0A8H6YSC8_9AGAR|nr:hypothetical protein MSAN_01052900 [Mycena sanguinolenta]
MRPFVLKLSIAEMSLDHLNADVLCLILALTDVYTILSLSRVNKYLLSISSSRPVWVSVVLDLSSRHLIDLPLDIIVENLSTEELKDEVKRVVMGPRTWSPTSLEPPTLLRRKVIPMQKRGFTDGCFRSTAYIITYVEQSTSDDGAGGNMIQLLETHTGRIVWSWSRLGHIVFEVQCEFRGRSAVAALVFSTPDSQESHILILELDLKTGDSRELLAIDGLLNIPFGLRISGDYFACETVHDNCVLLVNWSISQFIVFRTASCRMELCLGHLLLPHRGRHPHVRLYSFGLFDSLWAPISQLGFDSPTSLFESPPSLTLELASNNVPHHFQLSTNLFESPIHADTYDFISEVTSIMPRRTVLLTRLFSWFRSTPLPPLATYGSGKLKVTTRAQYRLTLGSLPGQPGTSKLPHFTVQSVVRHCRSVRRCTSRAGYGLWYGGTVPSIKEFVVQRLDSFDRVKPLKIPLPDDSPDEVPYDMWLTHSGAVLAMYRSKIVVSHYL